MISTSERAETMFPIDQVQELLRLFPGAHQAVEGGVTYILLPDLELPLGCAPSRVDVLLCPTARDNYASRLYYAQQISCGPPQNWHVQGVRILERNWFAFSWRTREGLRLTQMVLAHLDGLRTLPPAPL